MRISVVTPTWNRERFLPGLWDSFLSQTHADRELLVLDDSASPSPFLTGIRDARLRYLHVGERLSIGEKRNRLVEAASGPLVAFFDDDDLYAPHYLEAMAGALGDAALIKLVGWYTCAVQLRNLYYWDTSRTDRVHYQVGDGPETAIMGEQFAPDFVSKNVDGFGFSYLFRKDVFGAARFPDKNFGEDRPFVEAVRARGGRVLHGQDTAASVVHMLHAGSTSRVFPQYRLPPGAANRLFPELEPFLRRLGA